MPKAQVIHELGPPQVMQWEEWPVPGPGPGEVRLRHTAVGVNFADTYHRGGISHPWPVPPCPVVIGFEGVGIVEGVVHELAHNKMKTHGISFHHWERLLTNEAPTPEAIQSGVGEHLYASSVRKDLRRPMGACLSAHYSYLYVADTLLHLVESGAIGPPENYVRWIALQRDRVNEGFELINKHVRPDKAGELYFASMQEWARQISERTDRQIAATAEILAAAGLSVAGQSTDLSGDPSHGDAFIAN